MFSPFLSSLPRAQKNIWPLLANSKDCGFVLYGGTALTLRFGHRQSVDFDFFSSDVLSKNSTKLFSAIPLLNKSKIIQESDNTLTFLIENKVKVSFFGNIKFGCINYPELTDDENIYVASVVDIMATKLKTILQRISIKDYIDVVEIIRRGVSLETGLSAAMTLFPNKFPVYDSARTLLYFDIPELNTLSDTNKAVLVTAVKNIHFENIHVLPMASSSSLCYTAMKNTLSTDSNPVEVRGFPRA